MQVDADERIFTLHDCVALFQRKRKKIGYITAVCGFFIFLFLLTKTPQYKVEALFKEGESRSSGVKSLELLGGMGGKSDSQITSTIRSFLVTKPLIEQMGLQASVVTGKTLVTLYRDIRDNFRANAGKALEDPVSFRFKDVHYEGENGLSFLLRFEDRDRFEILNRGGKKLVSGRIGEEITFSGVRMTLAASPDKVWYRHNYLLSISPWLPVAEWLRGSLSLVPNKINKSVFQLNFHSRDRHLAVDILTAWIAQYHVYLKQEHDRIDQEQLSYLKKRQELLYADLDQAFDARSLHLSENLKKKGFVGVEDEVESVLIAIQEVNKRLLEMEFDLARLKQAEKDDDFYVLNNAALSDNLFKASSEISQLKVERDRLLISFDEADTSFTIQQKLEDLKEIRSRKEAVTLLQAQVEQNTPISLGLEFASEEMLCAWAKELSASLEEREDFSDYLDGYIRMLAVREKMLQERLLVPHQSEEEEMNLETATHLFIEYHKQLNESEAKADHYEMLKKEIERPDFEFSALSSVLSDPFSQKLMEQANATLTKLKDETHRSTKEGERWQEELAVDRKILKEHLEQLLKVERLKQEHQQEKIRSLQKTRLNCINQNISVLEEQHSSLIRQAEETIAREMSLLERKRQELRDQAAEMPFSWKQEKCLEMKMNLGVKMMTALSEMVEAKTTHHHLYQISSQVLNYPVSPTQALCPRLYTKAAVGGAAAGSLSFFFMLLVAIFRGFPSSLEKMRAMGLPPLGSLGFGCDGMAIEEMVGPDLEVLRQAALFLKEKGCVGLILGRGPDYSWALAQNFLKMSRKVVILRCDFGSKFRQEEGAGLLQYLKGEAEDVVFRNRNNLSFIPAGGYCPFGYEWMQSSRFSALLERLKKEYEIVFIVSRSPLDSAEAAGLLDSCQKALVTVCGEEAKALTPFSKWGQARFITSKVRR